MDLETADVLIAILFGAAGFFGGAAAERRHYRLSATSFASDYFRDLRAWASEAVDVLTEAAYCAKGRDDDAPPDAESCFRCRHQISALVDRGRFFIPNYSPDDVGTDKAAAYRGLRHPCLDLLVDAEQVLGNPAVAARFRSPRAALVEIKREFVSEIQEILDPRTQNKEIARLLRESRGDSTDKRSALDRLAERDYSDFSKR